MVIFEPHLKLVFSTQQHSGVKFLTGCILSTYDVPIPKIQIRQYPHRPHNWSTSHWPALLPDSEGLKNTGFTESKVRGVTNEFSCSCTSSVIQNIKVTQEVKKPSKLLLDLKTDEVGASRQSTLVCKEVIDIALIGYSKPEQPEKSTTILSCSAR